MRRDPRSLGDVPLRAAAIAAASLVPPAVLFVWLQHEPGYDLVFGSHAMHFLVVSFVAAMATILALTVMRAARHLPDARTFFLAMGFISMAGIFLAHGLGTAPFLGGHQHTADAGAGAASQSSTSAAPAGLGSSGYSDGYGDSYGSASSSPALGQASSAAAGQPAPDSPSGYDDSYGAAPPSTSVDHSEHGGHSGPTSSRPAPSVEVARIGLVGFSAELSLVVSSLFFALAVMDLGKRFNNLLVRHWDAFALMVIGPIALYAIVAVAFPTILLWIPVASRQLNWTVAEIAWVCFAFAGWRFLQSYRLSFLPLQGAMALSMALLIEAQWFMIEGAVWHLSWWEYHVAMLAAFLGAVIGLLLQFHSTGDLGAVIEGLFLRETVTGIRERDPRALRALGAAVAAKDGYTSAHVDRVSQMAVAIGEQMELGPEQLEVLRWAGRLHDLGKIGIPNSILMKPGRLNDAEFRQMQQHSARGWQAARKSGVLEKAAAAIRGHHERWNGSGYPDGLAGEAIPLEARIIAVADVWDAVTSDRPYRAGMSHQDAADLIRRDSGVLFDSRCVDALFSILQPSEAEAVF